MSMILLLMILLHIIDDFVLQPVCLGKLKQKSFWKNDELGKKELYRNDYKAALIIHGISWSIMVHLPLILLQLLCDYQYGELYICISVIIHAFTHAIIDNKKANWHNVSLVSDQLCHLGQLIIIFNLWFLFIYDGINL